MEAYTSLEGAMLYTDSPVAGAASVQAIKPTRKGTHNSMDFSGLPYVFLALYPASAVSDLQPRFVVIVMITLSGPW